MSVVHLVFHPTNHLNPLLPLQQKVISAGRDNTHHLRRPPGTVKLPQGSASATDNDTSASQTFFSLQSLSSTQFPDSIFFP